MLDPYRQRSLCALQDRIVFLVQRLALDVRQVVMEPALCCRHPPVQGCASLGVGLEQV